MGSPKVSLPTLMTLNGPLRSIKKEKFFTAGYTRTSNIYLTLVSYAEQKMFVIGRVIVVFFLQQGLINCQPVDKKLIGDQSGFVSVAFRGTVFKPIHTA